MLRHAGCVALAQLLLSGTLVHEGSFQELQLQYGTAVNPDVVFVISVDRYPDLASTQPEDWRTELGLRLTQVLVDTTQALHLPCFGLWTEEGVFALLAESTRDLSRRQRGSVSLRDIAELIQRNLDRAGISVSIGIGGQYHNPNLLYHSFHEATECMVGRFFQGNRLIFESQGSADEGHALNGVHDQIQSRSRGSVTTGATELLALVKIGDRQGAQKELQRLFHQMAEECAYHEGVFRSSAIDVVMLMSRAVLDSGVNAADILTENAKVIHELYGVIRYDKFLAKVCQYTEWLIRQIHHIKISSASSVVQETVLFLTGHHRQKLSLEDVARHACLGKYYLSHLFKEETGLSVMDYLNQIRLEKSLFYLETSELPIQEIAYQVGYGDANYFSRVFRKRLGMTPTQYRIARLC